MPKVYIVVPDYGPEGYGSPCGAYSSTDDVRAALAEAPGFGPSSVYELEVGAPIRTHAREIIP